MNYNHPCHAIGCDRDIRPSLVMCLQHWSMVPRNLQLNIWKNYRKGQENDKKPSEAYLRAQMAAINYIAELENREEKYDIEERISFLKNRGFFG